MKYLHNPISGEVRSTTPLEAKRLSAYGWKAMTKAEYQTAQREILAYIVKNRLSGVKVRLH